MKIQKMIVLGALVIGLPLVFAADEPLTHRIEQKNRGFSITEITVKPGEQIEFCNLDDVTHNVFSKSEKNSFNIKSQKPGGSSKVEFLEPGMTEVRCAIHPSMKLIVHVRP